jgi:hypothetical protein
MEELPLLGLHFPTLFRRSLVVITQQVQDTVDHQKENFFFGFPAYGLRLALGGFR